MNKKYEILNEQIEFEGRILHRIRAIRDFGCAKAGDLGGYIESENNLSQEGNAWIYDDAYVCGNARVYDNARVCCDALVFNETDILCVRGIGSEHHYTTVYMTKDGKPFVACGCFLGTLSEFEAKVKKTCDDSKYAREYQLFIELVKLHFNMKEER